MSAEALDCAREPEMEQTFLAVLLSVATSIRFIRADAIDAELTRLRG